MKLLCISTKTFVFKHRDHYTNITNGKIYEGNEYDKKFYMIRDDAGEVSLYPKKNFETISEVRDTKINQILK